MWELYWEANMRFTFQRNINLQWSITHYLCLVKFRVLSQGAYFTNYCEHL